MAAIYSMIQPELEQVQALVKAICEKLDTGDEWTYSRGVGMTLITAASGFRKLELILTAWQEFGKAEGRTVHAQSAYLCEVKTQHQAIDSLLTICSVTAAAAMEPRSYIDGPYAKLVKRFNSEG